MNKIVTVKASSGSYEVHIGQKLNYGKLLIQRKRECKCVVVSDDIVFALYGEQCMSQLKEQGFEVFSYVFPHGEKSKNLVTASEILEFCAQRLLTRTDLLVALGGGVTGDITGFAASVYLRGIDYVQIPTTFLAAIDSSVGGKTAVDLTAGKNLVGAFHQPIAVYCDTDTFLTLSEEIFAEGIAEAVKYGMIKDKYIFEAFESGKYDIADICFRCAAIKAEIVKKDEFDTGIRKILNFGHTIGHAVETLSGFEISHGKAVAIGMVMITCAVEKRGEIEEGTTKRLEKTLLKYGLPTKCVYGAKELSEKAMSDKKCEGSEISLLIPNRIGEVKIVKIKQSELEALIQEGV